MHKETNLPKEKILIAFILVVLILVADQWIKVYVKSTFSPNEIRPLFGEWFVLQYIENQGMAFGATFSTSLWGKLTLSLFRVFAIVGIAYYLISQARKGARKEFVIALSLILAGATGNLIDSMFYDYVFPYDPCSIFNEAHGSGNYHNCDIFGKIEVKHEGFLFGNVVDMFRFQALWPDWVPYLGGKDIFPAIWNLADGSITVGVFMVFFRQRKYFPKKIKEKTVDPVEKEITQDLDEGFEEDIEK
jgi:signal peptidase II